MLGCSSSPENIFTAETQGGEITQSRNTQDVQRNVRKHFFSFSYSPNLNLALLLLRGSRFPGLQQLLFHPQLGHY